MCIVGGGIVGWNAAITLAELYPTLRIILLEKDVYGGGASVRNAGFACFGSMTELMDDAARVGWDQTLSLVERRWKGLLELRQLLGDKAIDYQPVGGFELFKTQEQQVLGEVMDQMPAVNQALASIMPVEQVFTASPERVAAWQLPGIDQIIVNQAEGQLHPGKMMQQLIRIGISLGVEYWPGQALAQFEERSSGIKLTLKSGDCLTSQYVLFCTNGFTAQLLPELEIKPARNLVLVTQKVPHVTWEGTIHMHQGYIYARRVGERVLIGGGRHLDPSKEQTTAAGINPTIKRYLMDWLTSCLVKGEVSIDYEWSGVLGVGPHKSPIIQMISDRVGVAARLGGMGVAIGRNVGVTAAKLLAESLS